MEKNIRQNWVWSKHSSDLPGVGTYIIALELWVASDGAGAVDVKCFTWSSIEHFSSK